MPETENEKLRETLTKLAEVLCHQSKERKKREKEHDEKLEELITQGVKDLDAGLRDVAAKFRECCCPFKPGME